MHHATRPPNVLWVFCDQLRWNAVGCNGDPNVRTPHIDRLADEGANCTLAVSQYPICSPFRAGLVTGQYAHVNGLRVHGEMLPTDRRTVAHAFRDAGYRTSYVGKWHLASSNGVRGWRSGEDFWVPPQARGGFEDWFGFDASNHFYNTCYSHAGSMQPSRLDGYQTDALTGISLDYLAGVARAGRPWFHVLSVESPHPGCDEHDVYGNPSPEPYASLFDPKKLTLRGNVPPAQRDEARRRLAGYYGQIKNLDDNVGRLLKWLDETGEADRTLVAFFSDHGDLMGSHGMYEKNEPYDESARVPLLWRLPGVVPAGHTLRSPVSGIDLFPTTVGLCGLPTPAGVQGLDQSLAVRGLEGPTRRAALIQWMGPALQGFGDHPYRAIRTDRYLYCVGREERHRLLFDGQSDPLQERNRFADVALAEVRSKLHAELCNEVQRSGEPLPDFLLLHGPETTALGTACPLTPGKPARKPAARKVKRRRSSAG
jgi:arylsulfatase A-like enzyme